MSKVVFGTTTVPIILGSYMVNPVTGPHQKVENFYGGPLLNGYRPVIGRMVRVWYRQKRPYSKHLPYNMFSERVSYRGGKPGYAALNYWEGLVFLPPDKRLEERLYNDVYRSFMDEVTTNKASLGATIGEWKSSSAMISERANQLYQGFRAVKRGDLTGLKRAWGRHAGIRARARAGGSHVLEYSFGWAPLVKDLNDAMEVLTNRLPAFRIKRRKSLNYYDRKNLINTSNSYDQHLSTNVQIGWSLQGRIQMDNPNTAVAQQLGLVNLAAIAWELVPNSYVIDYFVNVGDFLSSFSDMVGLSFVESSKTFFKRTNAVVSNSWSAYTIKNGLTPVPYYDPFSWTYEGISVSRSLGIPGPTLDFHTPWNVSVNRAVTSIARLLQQLKS